MINNIVIFLQNRNFFGTQVTHIPFLCEVKYLYPQARITIITKHKVSSILKELSYCDNIIFENNKKELIQEYRKINPEITYNLRNKSLSTQMIMTLFNRKTKIGYSTNFTKIFFSKTFESNTSIYRSLNYLRLIDKKFNPVNIKKRDVVSILPGAGGKFKIWNLENYIKVAKFIESHYPLKVEFILGNEEKNMLEELKENFIVHFHTDITTLETNIYSSKLVIGNDCGPSHFAQISDVKTLILYSYEKNDAKEVISEWFNLQKNKYYLIGEKEKAIDTISVENVINKIKEILE